MHGSGEGEGHYVFFLKVWHKWQSVLREQSVVTGDQLVFIFTCPFYGPDTPYIKELFLDLCKIYFLRLRDPKASGTPGTPGMHRKPSTTDNSLFQLQLQIPTPHYLLTSFL